MTAIPRIRPRETHETKAHKLVSGLQEENPTLQKELAHAHAVERERILAEKSSSLTVYPKEALGDMIPTEHLMGDLRVSNGKVLRNTNYSVMGEKLFLDGQEEHSIAYGEKGLCA